MRVFYSHPMKLYGSAAERREISQIEARFPGWEMVNPSAYRSKVEPGRETEYYLALVDTCDLVVFSRFYGNVTEGVKPEVDHALARGKPVNELRGGRFIPVVGPVVDLPLWERLAMRAKGALGRGQQRPA